MIERSQLFVRNFAYGKHEVTPFACQRSCCVKAAYYLGRYLT